MTPELYCRKIVAAHDPGFFFSLKKLTASQCDAATAVMAFFFELDNIIFECQEPAVAFTKINWWHLETRKLIANESVNHPVLLALQQSYQRIQFSLQRLLDMIDGMAQNLNLSPFKTFEDVMMHIIHTAGLRELLIAEIVQPKQKISPETVYQLTLILELTRYVQHLRRYVRRGLIIFGEDELETFHVSVKMLQMYHTTPDIKNLLQYQIEKSEQAFRKAAVDFSGLTHLIVRSEMALALLREIKNSDYAVLENLINLTPLRCWWIVFKNTCVRMAYSPLPS